MASSVDGEIIRDFIVEAGEILEKLGEELVKLDRNPADGELLNGIFRGFHTIKGGASFLNIEPVVALCHGAEDLFSLCRSGELLLDARGIDLVLRTADELGTAFDALRNNAAPSPASPALLAEVRQYAAGAAARAGAGGGTANTAGPDDPGPHDAPHTPAQEGAGLLAPAALSDADFEALLDRLHGKGKPGGKGTHPTNQAPGGDLPAPPRPPVAVPEPAPAADKPQRQPEATLRIETRRLDAIMNLVGELVLARNRLLSLESLARDENTGKAINDLDLIISDLQVAVMKSRMQPIQKIFARFPRVVRDLARSLDKEVALEISGEETDLEKNMVESLADPLVHLVRNAIDHGIESPDEREAAGKSRHGNVVLAAYQEGDRVVVKISDDGAGIDPERLREAAVRKHLMDARAAERLTEKECLELMFAPGLTTRQQASDISGRGVGMDVVRTKIEQLGGTIEVSSGRNVGTTIVIRLPLTLAILPTLMIGLGDQVFALPLSCVVEILHSNPAKARLVDGQPVLVVRGKPLPLFFLGHWLVRDQSCAVGEHAQIIVVRIGPRRIAFVVDSLFGQEEVVIKPLGVLVHGTRGLAGATITGDGRVALVLDVPELLSAHVADMAVGA